MNKKFYYTNARYNGKTVLLAGPFPSASDAEACIDLLYELFHQTDTMAQLASYGVLETNRDIGLGCYNAILHANGITVQVPEN